MPKQLTRLLIVFAVLGGGMLYARHRLLPKTFGERGHYRAAAVVAIQNLPVKYAGREVCAGCHTDIADMHAANRHQSVSCEVCHGPGAAHTEAPTDVVLTKPNKRTGCPLCHSYNPSRPTGFPQIDPQTHNPMKACVSCHNPHKPETPHVPGECSACHGEIARTKAVSRHAGLDCNECHNAPAQHKVTPRDVHPEKPATRAFCGKCHSKDASSPKEIPRINLDSHGGRYLCWQCHYPHLPEGTS